MDGYKPIELDDKPIFDEYLRRDPPQISELTFTNLFMWRRRYGTLWCERDDLLYVLFREGDGKLASLPPVGTGDKAEGLAFLADLLGRYADDVRIERSPADFVRDYASDDRFDIVQDRDNSDYVYLADELIRLPGNRFHRKKNHVNRFLKNYSFEYRSLEGELARKCMDLQESWCELRDCADNQDLADEDRAVYEALSHFDRLGIEGGAVLINGRVEAFSFGEMLNPDTAVIHIEKANPDIGGLYAAINQMFCSAAWSNATYINREQDLGVEGLRRAKQSYNPHHLVEKFTLIPKVI